MSSHVSMFGGSSTINHECGEGWQGWINIFQHHHHLCESIHLEVLRYDGHMARVKILSIIRHPGVSQYLRKRIKVSTSMRHVFAQVSSLRSQYLQLHVSNPIIDQDQKFFCENTNLFCCFPLHLLLLQQLNIAKQRSFIIQRQNNIEDNELLQGKYIFGLRLLRPTKRVVIMIGSKSRNYCFFNRA